MDTTATAAPPVVIDEPDAVAPPSATPTEPTILWSTAKAKDDLANLVPGIKDDLASAIVAAKAAAMPLYREAGIKLLEAQRIMRAAGRYYGGTWASWLKKNFSLSQRTASDYMRLGKVPVSSTAAFSSVREALKDPGTRRSAAGRKPGPQPRPKMADAHVKPVTPFTDLVEPLLPTATPTMEQIRATVADLNKVSVSSELHLARVARRDIGVRMVEAGFKQLGIEGQDDPDPLMVIYDDLLAFAKGM